MKHSQAKVFTIDPLEKEKNNLKVFLILVFSALLIFLKNLFIDNAVVFQDEYLYKISSDLSVDKNLLESRHLVDLIPNKIYLGLYGICSYFGANFYAISQLINIIFWTLGNLIYYTIYKSYIKDDKFSLVYLIVIVTLPLSVFTKYFMPESMYFFIFSLTLYYFLSAEFEKSTLKFLVSGALVGILYFVKPHALIIILTNSIYLLFFSKSQKSLRLAALLFGFFISFTFISIIISTLSNSGTVLAQGFYGKLVSKLYISFLNITNNNKIYEETLYVLSGNLLFIFSIFGLAYYYAIAIIFPKLNLLKESSNVPYQQKILSKYFLSSSSLLIVVVVVFTVLNSELGHIHSRYYFFIFPLAAIFFFCLPMVNFTKIGMFIALSIVSLVNLILYYKGPSYSEFLYASVVSGSPELGYLFSSKSLYLYLCFFLWFTSVLTIINTKKNLFFVTTFVFISLISNYIIADKQKHLFRTMYTTGNEVIAIEGMIGRENMNHALVIGENLDQISKFLFFTSSTPKIDFLEPEKNINFILKKFPGIEIVILLSDRYNYPLKYNCIKVGENPTLCLLKD